jgi:hypothetical protein
MAPPGYVNRGIAWLFGTARASAEPAAQKQGRMRALSRAAKTLGYLPPGAPMVEIMRLMFMWMSMRLVSSAMLEMGLVR